MPSLPFAALTRLSPQILSVNVKSAFMLTKEFVPHIRRNGSIVYMSSIGAYQPFALIGAYSVAKTALLGLTKAVANQCKSLSRPTLSLVTVFENRRRPRHPRQCRLSGHYSHQILGSALE
jgi:NAD(P)-dependent dehydrogenase (short-subunit alcohol dehydrogenase family)